MALIQAAILLITGIMASGKSTVAQRLAERLDRSVHLRGDVFRRMIVNGGAKMTPDASEEAFKQLWLRYRLTAVTARMYHEAGFNVVYQDIIPGSYLNDVAKLLQDVPLYVVVLCPTPEVVARREIDLWLDSSTLTVDQTADAVLAQIDQARIALRSNV